MRRQEWRHLLPIHSLIVPSPMLKVEGLTQAGKKSQHTLEATGRRVYLVIDFDFASDHPLVNQWAKAGITVADACAALHLYLARRLPLVLVTHSGGKSLHGWYYAFELSEFRLEAFMAEAIRLGADPATWGRSLFVRLPDGERENGCRQRCFYLNPQNCVSL